MELLTIKTRIVILSSLVLASCTEIDWKGMFIPEESANDRFRQSETYNADNGFRQLNVENEAYSIFIMGDSHVGNTHNLGIFFTEARTAKAAAIVMNGDLTNGKKEEYEAFDTQLPLCGSVPYFSLAGNHDMNFDGWKEYWTRFGSSTYYFTISTPKNSDLYICLESGAATLGKNQMEWVRKVLKEKRSGYRHCVVFTHTNIFRLKMTEASLYNTEEMYQLMDLFARYNVELVVTAHDHRLNDDTLGNTTYIVLPALLEGAPDTGYMKLNVNESMLSYDFTMK
jgi:predicted phosphodiesterase